VPAPLKNGLIQTKNETMKTKYLESFPTIDQCVEYLVSIGCKWNSDKEDQLNKKGCFKFKDTLVMYDPHNLLSL